MVKGLKLLRVRPALRPSAKKYVATFIKDGQVKRVAFGARGYEDFTQHRDAERQRLYILRHRKNEDWTDPMTAGALSRFILWNKPSLKESIRDFRRRFRV